MKIYIFHLFKNAFTFAFAFLIWNIGAGRTVRNQPILSTRPEEGKGHGQGHTAWNL